MSKITVADTSSGYDLATINANFDLIAEQMNTMILYSDPPSGEPNQMQTTLDMNGNPIINLPAPTSPSSPLRLQDLTDTGELSLAASNITFTPPTGMTSTNIQAAVDEVYADLVTTNTHVTSNTSAITTLNGEVTTLQGDVTSIDGNITTLQGDVTTINGEIAALQAAIGENNGVIVISNLYSGLSSVNHSQYSVFLTEGYYSAGDGGHGLYRYVPSDTTSASNNFTIVIDGSGGRWYLVPFNDQYNVKQAGAVASGSTSSTPADCSTPFATVYSTVANGSEVIVPPGFYNLVTGPTNTGKNLIWRTAGAFGMDGVTPLSGLPGVQYSTYTNYPEFRQDIGLAEDYATLHTYRNANYSGGDPGYVNANLLVETVVASSATSFEWGLISKLANSATAGNSVAGYLQGTKETTGTGPTWAGTFEVIENVAIANPTTGTIGIEVDVRSNGTDGNSQRVGIDVVCSKQNSSGAGTQTGYGVRVQNNGQSDSEVIAAFSMVASNCSVAFDSAYGTVSTAALRMAAGQAISFDVNSTNQMKYSSSANGIVYTSGGSQKVALVNNGSIQLNGTNSVVITGNVNSAGTGIEITIDGTSHSLLWS